MRRKAPMFLFALLLLPFLATPVHAETQVQPYAVLTLVPGVPEGRIGDTLVFSPLGEAETIEIRFDDAMFAGDVARSACLESKIMDQVFCGMEGYTLPLGCGPGTITPPHPIDATWELTLRIHAAGADPGIPCSATTGVASVTFS